MSTEVKVENYPKKPEHSNYTNYTQWETSKEEELKFWRSIVETNGLNYKQDWQSRQNSEQPLQEYITKYLPINIQDEVSILDVGAGPLTILGKLWKGYKLKITAVDALAKEYNQILQEFGITPLIRTQLGEVEKLATIFQENEFDLVHICNALDHSYDPVLGILNMLAVVKPNSYVVLKHHVNEGEHENYVGMHQWNLDSQDNNFIIWNKKFNFNLNEILADIGEIFLEKEDQFLSIAIKKRANISSNLITQKIQIWSEFAQQMNKSLDFPSSNERLSKEQQTSEVPENRYAKDWNSYSKKWDQEYGSDYKYLGDEWNDDSTAERKRDDFYFTAYADRFINSDMTVLEVGPGGGKWTVRIAPKVKKLIVLDVAEEMLNRTKARCKSLGIDNVEYILANGLDFQPIADDSIDFFFSYDVFVHIALEDTFAYAKEMYRILKPNCQGICHYAINSMPQAWHRIESNNDWYRHGKNSLGQFYYYSPESLMRMFEYCGLSVKEQHIEGWHCTCLFQKPQQPLLGLSKDEMDLTNAYTQISKLKQKLQIKENELQQAKLVIEAMKTSKFWKMRTKWFSLKKLMNLSHDDTVC